MQAEYEREGIAWKPLSSPHGEGPLRLIEDPAGLLALLDEQCRLGERGSDDGFCSSLLRQHEASPHLRAPRMARAPGEFTLLHYAGEVPISARPTPSRPPLDLRSISAHLASTPHPQVTYWAAGFVRKNRESLPDALTALLGRSSLDRSAARSAG